LLAADHSKRAAGKVVPAGGGQAGTH